MKQIKATIAQNRIPRWARLERQLIDTMNRAIDPILEKYLHPDGKFLWPYDEQTFQSVDGLDDAYESFHTWPLFYLIGGDDRFLSLAHREYDVVTEQFSHYPTGHGHPMVVKEYEQGYDWMHQGEGYEFFYLLNLADPTGGKNRERSIRYAGFYLNEDPDIEPNYDPEHRMLKCCYVGSMGPAHRNFSGTPWGYAGWKQDYGLPFHDLSGIATIEDMKDEAKALRMGTALKERLAYGDTAVNLFSTSMVMNAYLHTGEEKYKLWIDEYAGAWSDRAVEQNGMMPDNVGPNGVVGECLGERWYGGYYGWTWPHGLPFILEAVTTAAQNRALLNRTNDMAWPRTLLERVMEHGIERDGTWYVPQKYADPGSIQEYHARDRFLTDPGAVRVTDRDDFSVLLVKDDWFEFQVLPGGYSAHMMMISGAARDMEIARTLRDHTTDSYRKVRHFYAKNQGGHDDAWLGYLDGAYPNYPEEILEHNLFQVYDRMKQLREDDRHPSTYDNAYLQRGNPITCEGLVQLTMGGPLPLYNGGLLQVALRYYDADSRRPGLPADVAALVSSLGNDQIEVTLVNISPLESRNLIMQAGTYGEHEFTTVEISQEGANSEKLDVGDTHVRVELGPGSVITLKAGLKRFAKKPSYDTPLDSGRG